MLSRTALQPALAALLGSVVMAAKILRASDACTLYAMPPRVGQSCGRTVGNAPASTMLAAVPVGQQGIDDRSAQASQA